MCVMKIDYVDRKSGEIKQEEVYGGKALQWVWGKSLSGSLCRYLVSHFSFFSALYGWLQKRPSSKKKVIPFIEKFGVDPSEFENNFASFNDFFIRELKLQARPIDSQKLVAPADARYHFYEKAGDSLFVKGKNYTLAPGFTEGPCLIARLCPSDYHRFHFPCDGTPQKAELIPGPLFSVNPFATKIRPSIFSENRRMITQTYTPNQSVKKGYEKGYFSFGGSALILLFEKGSLTFDQDLLENTQKGYETYLQLGNGIGM